MSNQFDENKYIPKVASKNLSKQYFANNIHRTPIRNAMTGDRYNYRVGTIDEKRFWTVMVPNCNNETGITESVKLFYDNPEQYEKHRNVELSRDVKEKWHNDNIEFMKEHDDLKQS